MTQFVTSALLNYVISVQGEQGPQGPLGWSYCEWTWEAELNAVNAS